MVSALSRLFPVASPLPSTPYFFRDSARQPTGVPQLALLLSLLNIPHAAVGLGSGEAERGKNTPPPLKDEEITRSSFK
jgi:hypothetical protein